MKADEMTEPQMLEWVAERMGHYSGIAQTATSAHRKNTGLKENEVIDQRHIDAVLVDFVNFLWAERGVNLGLSVKDQ